mmetsp:Transcript_71779/g.149914  ORF Transcript_71779/g.149914 Transcript_71779/m.149914 type:complete len:330 (+) Transcript_71779:213-1202(+)|eukprot:CAMPEP_0181299238 /NCGR_PEP_ID=MMETSP1101-20121128/6233_1 /TAXON_ID=46948 /ORGANISM="Rhodomonas abbreviata, Strain Caron Lab Isolate" /LENGTH=329 /DNA_ID=CAMNT_0023404361 /DNA_START=210 /DNA_END=1199 /DNA_ORIENTATION=-
MAGTKRSGLRPELAILLLLIVAVPLIGWQAYRKITFQFTEIMTAITSHPCSVQILDGSEYDLTGLGRTKADCDNGDQKSCLDYHVHRNDDDFYLNVCKNVMRKPAECSNLFGGDRNVHPSIGYQTADGVCYYMGQLRTGRWSLLDSSRPEAGLKLTYTGGSQCDGSTERSTEYRFECNADAGKGEPVAVFGDCDFVVTWETALACPVKGTPLLTFLFWAVMAFAAYLFFGFLYNVRFTNAEADWEAVPHIHYLRWFLGLTSALSQQFCELLGDKIPYVGAGWMWLQDKAGGGYEAISSRFGGEGGGSKATVAKPPGGTGILDRQGYDQL